MVDDTWYWYVLSSLQRLGIIAQPLTAGFLIPTPTPSHLPTCPGCQAPCGAGRGEGAAAHSEEDGGGCCVAWRAGPHRRGGSCDGRRAEYQGVGLGCLRAPGRRWCRIIHVGIWRSDTSRCRNTVTQDPSCALLHAAALPFPKRLPVIIVPVSGPPQFDGRVAWLLQRSLHCTVYTSMVYCSVIRAGSPQCG